MASVTLPYTGKTDEHRVFPDERWGRGTVVLSPNCTVLMTKGVTGGTAIFSRTRRMVRGGYRWLEPENKRGNYLRRTRVSRGVRFAAVLYKLVETGLEHRV